MSQVTKGVLLGGGIGIFRAAGLPSAQTDQEIVNAAIGSLFINTNGGSMQTLFCLVSPGNWQNVA